MQKGLDYKVLVLQVMIGVVRTGHIRTGGELQELTVNVGSDQLGVVRQVMRVYV